MPHDDEEHRVACEKRETLWRFFRGQPHWTHAKTGGRYTVTDVALDSKTLAVLVVYRCISTGVSWVRAEAEFRDGRFLPGHQAPRVGGLRRANDLERGDMTGPGKDAGPPCPGCGWYGGEHARSCMYGSAVPAATAQELQQQNIVTGPDGRPFDGSTWDGQAERKGTLSREGTPGGPNPAGNKD